MTPPERPEVAAHDHEHFGTGPRVEPEPIWSCMGCGKATNHFVTGSLVHPEDGLCATCVAAIRGAAEPLRGALDLRALDEEIARRESPDYQWFPKPSANQTPAGRAGSAAARAMQHGELTGLKIARAALEATAPSTPEPALDVRSFTLDLRRAVSSLPERYGGFGLVRRTEVDAAIVTTVQRWDAALEAAVRT